jgi:hypothetical protein
MSEAKPELPDLDELISASAHETFPTEETNADTPHPKLNHQWVVLLSWVTCACIAGVLYSYPVHDESDLGIRSKDVRLGVAMYHVAHRIESYRYMSGALPEFLDDSWGDLDRFSEGSDAILYEKSGNGYTLHGEAGNLRVRFKDGDNPEQLLHDLSKFEVSDP